MQLFADAVALFFVLQFLWSYYRTCWRKGYKIDIWHFAMAQMMFVIHIMLPFARSPLNVVSLGPGLLVHTLPFVNEAYLISALGYAAMLTGGQVWRLHLGAGLRRISSEIVALPARGALMMMQSPGILTAIGGVSLILSGFVLSYYFRVMGFGFNLRGLLLVVPALRAGANLVLFLSVQIGTLALARAIVYRDRRMGWLFAALAFVTLFYGSRAHIVGMASSAVLFWAISRRKHLKLWVVVLGGYGVLLMIFAMDALRSGTFSPAHVLAGFGVSMFYGNSFSDTRDFALVLSYWDGHYFLGKTYLAGLFAFVPRFLSPFRDKWAIGVVTASMAGFLPTEHPGLRVGTFGEAYLNFGPGAVVLLGLVLGYVLRLVDLRTKEGLRHGWRSPQPYAYAVLGAFTSPLINSSTASEAYSVLFLLCGAWLALKVHRELKPPVAPRIVQGSGETGA